MVARPFSRASDKSIFSFLFSGIETSLNRHPPHFLQNQGELNFSRRPGVGFFNLSLNFPHLYSFSPFVFLPSLNLLSLLFLYYIPPLFPENASVCWNRYKPRPQKKSAEYFCESVFRFRIYYLFISHLIQDSLTIWAGFSN